MALTARVIIPDLGPEPEVEDIYAIHLAYLFTDHIPNAHGDPGTSIAYKSPLFGDITLRIPKHPDLDTDRQLFAHYLWNAAVIAAEAIESASANEEASKTRTDDRSDPWQQLEWNHKYWDMRNADVLELGAGTALPSIISYLSGARSLTTTDHPSSTAVTTNTITTNLVNNIYRNNQPGPSVNQTIDFKSQDNLPPSVNVYGYLWGETNFYQRPTSLSSLTITTTIIGPSSPTDVPLEPLPKQQQPQLHTFTKIIVADCLWVPSKHAAICKTILDYLQNTPAQHDNTTDPKPEGIANTTTQKQPHDQPQTRTPIIQPQPCALIIAGFHTGRAITSDFFAIATDAHPHTSSRVHYDTAPISDDDPLTAKVRGRLKIAEIFEVDINGQRREWMAHRPGESRDDTKRWCVCAALVRR